MDWSAFAGGIGSLAGSLIGYFANENTNDINMHNVNQTNAMNHKIAKEQNAFQAEQLEKQQQFSAEEAQKAREWDSPINQLKRYQEAGINPSVAFAGGLSNASSAQAQAPTSGVSPSLPTMIPATRQMPFNIAGGMSDSFLKIAQAIKSIRESKLAESQKNEIDSMLSDRIAQLKATTEGQELANSLAQLYAEPKAKAELALLGKQALLAAQQGNTQLYEQALKDSETRLNQLLSKEHGQDYELKKKQNETYMQELRARVENLHSQSQRNIAEAENARAQASYSRDALQTSSTLRRKMAAETLEAYEKRKGIHLDNDEKERLTPLILKQLENDIRQQGQDYWNPFHYAGQILGGAGAAGVHVLAK